MKYLNWFTPVRGHRTHHLLPCIHAKLGQSLDTVNHKVSHGRRYSLSARVDVRTLVVDSDKVLWRRVAVCGGACACFLRRLGAVVVFICDLGGVGRVEL
jgi:hypothetical protein